MTNESVLTWRYGGESIELWRGPVALISPLPLFFMPVSNALCLSFPFFPPTMVHSPQSFSLHFSCLAFSETLFSLEWDFVMFS